MKNLYTRFQSKKLFVYILSVFFSYNLLAQDVEAGFFYTVSGGCDSVEVSFTDTSLYSPISWQWNFSDGTSTTEQNPTKVFIGEGSYSVSFIISNGLSTDTVEMIDFVTVYASPEAPDIGPSPRTIVILSNGTSSFAGLLEVEPSVSGNIISWFYEDGTLLLENSTVYDTGIDENTPTGYYSFVVKEGHETSGGICYSDPATITLDVARCPALTPEGDDFYYCIGSSDPITANVSAASGSTGSKISWFTYDPVGQTGAGIADLTDDNLVYTSFLNTASAGSEVVYAAEYDMVNNCWSAGLPVMISIVDNPEVEITPQNIEIAMNQTISINAIPSIEGGTGMWSGIGVAEITETSALFTPEAEGSVSASYIYTSSAGCESEEQFFDITVTAEEILIQQDSLSVTTVPGELEMTLLDYDLSSITKLTVSGEIQALDIYFMRDSLPNLAVIDISQATIVAFEGDVEEEVLKVFMSFDAHSLPSNAFIGKETLQEIYLPESILAISDGAFENCSALSFIVLNTESPELIEVSIEAFTGVSTESCAVVVPEGTKDDYGAAEVWKDFLKIGESVVEITGVDDIQYSITVVQFEDELIIKGISSEATVFFISLDGKKVMSLEILGVTSISTSMLSHGLYTLQIISDEGFYHKKLLIQ